MSRTIEDIPERQLACYEWQPVEAAPTKLKDGDVCCVSVPFTNPPRAIAEWRKGRFLEAGMGTILKGVTYFAYCPSTPEDFDQDQAAQKKTAANEPDLFAQAAAATELNEK